MEKEKAALNRQLNETQFFISKAKTKEAILYWLNSFAAEKKSDPNYRKTIIDTFINSVFIYENGDIVITYNWESEPKHKITLSDLNGTGDSTAE